jgi:hypothetical protein
MSSSYPDLQNAFNQAVIEASESDQSDLTAQAITISTMLFNWYIGESNEIEQGELTMLYVDTVNEASTYNGTLNTLILDTQAQYLKERLVNGFTTKQMGVTDLVTETDESPEILALREKKENGDTNESKAAGAILRHLLRNPGLTLSQVDVPYINGIGAGLKDTAQEIVSSILEGK